jgi:hypothetical protein
LGRSAPEIKREISLHAIAVEQRRAVEGVEKLAFGPKFGLQRGSVRDSALTIKKLVVGAPGFEPRPPAPIYPPYPSGPSTLRERQSRSVHFLVRSSSDFNNSAWDKSVGSQAHSDIASPWPVLGHSLTWGGAYDM